MDRIDIWRCKISGERDRCVGAGLSPFNYSQAEQYCGTRMLLPSVEADLISTLYAPTSWDVDIATWLSVRLAPVPLAICDSLFLFALEYLHVFTSSRLIVKNLHSTEIV